MIWFAFILFGVLIYVALKIVEEMGKPCPREKLGYPCRYDKCDHTHYEKPEDYER